MFVSAFRRLVISLFRGTVVEAPNPMSDGAHEAWPARSGGLSSGIPDELAERDLPQATPLPQPPPPGN